MADPFINVTGLPEGRLVLRVRENISPELAGRIRREFAEVIGRNVVILGGGFDVESLDALVDRAAKALCEVDARHALGLAQGDTDEDHPAILARAAIEAAIKTPDLTLEQRG